MKRLLLFLMAFCLPINGCTTTKAAAEIPELSAAGIGDSVKVVVGGKFTGNADSVLLILTDSTAIGRWKPDTIRFLAPVPANWTRTRIELPVPPYQQASRQVVRATLQGFYKGQPGAIATRYASYVVPAGPPGSGTIDSVDVSPAFWTGPWNDTASFQVTTYLKGGTRVSVTKKVWTGLKPGLHYVVALERSEVPTVHVDTAWLNVQAVYKNQPAGFTNFATMSRMAALPPQVRGPMPGEVGGWYALASSNLKIVQDSSAAVRILP